MPYLTHCWRASARATNAPVMEAVRVPPSACTTSQSSVTVRSPNSAMSTTARNERPIRRWISCVRPEGRPLFTSRGVRFMVARGSMEYSAVTHPLPLPRRNCGTESSTEAAHSTRVLPTVMSVEPSAVCRYPVVISTGRIWSGARLSIRIFHHEVEKKEHENEARAQQDHARQAALQRGAALRFAFCEFELRHSKRPSLEMVAFGGFAPRMAECVADDTPLLHCSGARWERLQPVSPQCGDSAAGQRRRSVATEVAARHSDAEADHRARIRGRVRRRRQTGRQIDRETIRSESFRHSLRDDAALESGAGYGGFRQGQALRGGEVGAGGSQGAHRICAGVAEGAGGVSGTDAADAVTVPAEQGRVDAACDRRCLDERLRLLFPSRDCETARLANLAGLKNGQLLDAAEAMGFDILITVDQHVPDRQNLAGRRISLVILCGTMNRLRDLELLAPAAISALRCIGRGEVKDQRAGRYAAKQIILFHPRPDELLIALILVRTVRCAAGLRRLPIGAQDAILPHRPTRPQCRGAKSISSFHPSAYPTARFASRCRDGASVPARESSHWRAMVRILSKLATHEEGRPSRRPTLTSTGMVRMVVVISATMNLLRYR